MLRWTEKPIRDRKQIHNDKMIYFKFTKRFICWECTRTNQFRIVPDSLQLVWNYFACFKDCSLRKQIYTLWNSFIADWKLFNPLSIPEFYFSLRISQLKWCRNKCIFAINDQINVQGQTCTFRFFSTLHLETWRESFILFLSSLGFMNSIIMSGKSADKC